MKKVLLIAMACLMFAGCEAGREVYKADEEFDVHEVKLDFELLNPADNSLCAEFKIKVRNFSDEKIWLTIENGKSSDKSTFIWSGKIERGASYTVEKTPGCDSTYFIIEIRDSSGNFITKEIVDLRK